MRQKNEYALTLVEPTKRRDGERGLRLRVRRWLTGDDGAARVVRQRLHAEHLQLRQPRQPDLRLADRDGRGGLEYAGRRIHLRRRGPPYKWTNTGSGSIWTQAVKSVVVKWDGVY